MNRIDLSESVIYPCVSFLMEYVARVVLKQSQELHGPPGSYYKTYFKN